VADYRLETHHLKLLQALCEAWDRLQQAREILARDGVTFQDDRGNFRSHPAVNIERDARTAVARLTRELDLDSEAPVSERVGPPALRSNRGAR
jgi:P27 family predicted phage terminase small subunit